MRNLFAQLGQANDAAAIDAFIETHAPLPGGMQLHEAVFWSTAQSRFLLEAISDDADWVEVAESLNAQLHARH